MRNRGMTVYQITTVEGINEKTVYRRIDEALNARLVPTVDRYRTQAERLFRRPQCMPGAGDRGLRGRDEPLQ
jgi:hypothetical protein